MPDKIPKPDVYRVAQLYVRPFTEHEKAAEYAALLQQLDPAFDGAEIYEAARVRLFNKAGEPAVAEQNCYVVVAWDNAPKK